MFIESEMSRQPRASAVDGVQGNEGEGCNRRSGGKPNQGNAQRGENRSTLRETAVDENWKDMAHRVARHQAD